jgi:hypothetical protein
MRVYHIPKGLGIRLKIMVSPVRIRVPPLKKLPQMTGKPKIHGIYLKGFGSNAAAVEL